MRLGAPKTVSNPHRYGQKDERVATLRVVGGQFQTLIGTVKRWRPPVLTSGPGAFQTLIGTVKSGWCPGSPGESALVSNPHRYGQKCGLGLVGEGHAERFQTLIGTVKREDSLLPWRA